MAALEDIADALRNAHAAGDTAAAQKLADAYVQMQGSAPAAPEPVSDALKVSNPGQNWSNVGAESLDQAGIRPLLKDNERNQARAVTAIPFNLGDEAVAAGRGVADVARGRGFSPGYNEELTHARDVQKRYASESPVESVAMGIPGNIAASYALPGGPIVQAAESGFIQGFGGGEGGLVNRTGSGAVGAATGAATAGALRGTGRAMSQPNVNADVKLLQDEGIKLTPGMMGGKFAKKTEDIATSVPVMGDLIAKRQNESIEGLSRAVANRSLVHIGKTLPKDVPAGRETVAYVKKAMSDAYDSVLSKLSAAPDQPFAAEMQNVTTGAASKLPAEQLAKFQKVVGAQIGKFGGKIDGDTIKGIESELSSEIKGYGSGSWDDQKLAAALSDVQTAFRNTLSRQNPKYAPDLKKVNAGYANYAILRRAGRAVGNDGGVFTPAQLQAAVQAQDESAGKGAFASGQALMQDLADAVKKVLPSKFQDSGTARRLMQLKVMGLGGGAGAGAAALTGTALPAAIATGTALGVGSAAYTTPGQALARALMTGQRPAAVAGAGQGLKAISPHAATLAALLASQPSY